MRENEVLHITNEDAYENQVNEYLSDGDSYTGGNADDYDDDLSP